MSTNDPATNPAPLSAKPLGRIDVHNHILPAVDDGCATMEESVQNARALVEHGYTHVFCTPHIVSGLSVATDAKSIRLWVDQLQAELTARDVPLRLYPCAEHNVHNLYPRLSKLWDEEIVSYGLRGKYMLMDMWTEHFDRKLEETVGKIQQMGITPILAHPERMTALHRHPELIGHIQSMGVLLQGNLQCFSDAPGQPTRRLVEKWLLEDRYFMLGTDLHGPQTQLSRFRGLERAIEVGGEAHIDRLTRTNPAKLLGLGADAESA